MLFCEGARRDGIPASAIKSTHIFFLFFENFRLSEFFFQPSIDTYVSTNLLRAMPLCEESLACDWVIMFEQSDESVVNGESLSRGFLGFSFDFHAECA